MAIPLDHDFETNPWEEASSPCHSPTESTTQQSATPSGSLFAQATDVKITGSSLYSVGGNVITINTNIPSPITQDAAQLPRRLTVSSRSSASLSSTLRPDKEASPIHESEVYARNLLNKKHGYPLWTPQPPDDLPLEYRQNGISIGDVGVITRDGVFDFLFNVFLPADDPINRGKVPAGFVPLSATTRDVRVNETAWGESSCVSSHSIRSQKLYFRSTCSAYVFTCTSSDGAILALPNGALRQDLRNMKALQAYASEHAISWYKYMNQDRGLNAPNGSLYVVTGCDKTAVWGNACFSDASNHEGPEGFQLQFSLSFFTHDYYWEQTALASTNSSFNPAGIPPSAQNQCIFFRGFKIRLRESPWKLMKPAVKVQDISTLAPNDILSVSKYIPFGQESKSLASKQKTP